MSQRSVFISYAREDRSEVEASADLLRAGGVRVFIDLRDIAYGELWQQSLQQALQSCERVLVFWSLAARASEWVEREWRIALDLGKRIVPALLDDTPLPPELSQFHALLRPRRTSGPSEPAAAGPRIPVLPAPVAGEPAASAPPSRRTLMVVAALVALSGAGAGGWWLLLSPRGGALPETPPTPSPSPSPHSPSPPAQVPSPGPVSPHGIEFDAVAALLTLSDFLKDDDTDAVAIERRRALLQRNFATAGIEAMSARELHRAADAAESALGKLELMQRMLARGEARFGSPQEQRAFEALFADLRQHTRVLREASARRPIPAPEPQPSPPLPAAPEDPLWPWLLVPTVPLAGWLVLSRRRVPEEAEHFVREVFAN